MMLEFLVITNTILQNKQKKMEIANLLPKNNFCLALKTIKERK